MFGSKERKDFTKEKAYWKKVNRPANLRERLVGGGAGGDADRGQITQSLKATPRNISLC